MVIGVLALQGGVREHADMLSELGVTVRLVRSPRDLPGLEGIVLPGGESSTMDRLLRKFDLFEPLKESLLPSFGTCAGLITLATKVLDPAPGQQSLGLLDVAVRRNAIGPQRDSSVKVIAGVEAAFIRAPEIVSAGPGVDIIAQIDDHIYGVEQASPYCLGVSFHPELTGDTTLHKRFLEHI